MPDSSVLSPSHTQTRRILPSHLQQIVFPGGSRSPGLSETFLISRTCLHPPSLLVDTRGPGPAEPGQRAAQGSLCHSVSPLSLCAGTCVSVTRSTRCSSRAEGSWQPARSVCHSLAGDTLAPVSSGSAFSTSLPAFQRSLMILLYLL